MSLLVLLITRIGKKFSDCGKHETHDPGAVFFLHLGFPCLHLSFVRRKSGHVNWQRAGTLSGWVPTIDMCRLSEPVARYTAGKNRFCCVPEPVDVLHALTRCFEWDLYQDEDSGTA